MRVFEINKCQHMQIDVRSGKKRISYEKYEKKCELVHWNVYLMALQARQNDSSPIYRHNKIYNHHCCRLFLSFSLSLSLSFSISVLFTNMPFPIHAHSKFCCVSTESRSHTLKLLLDTLVEKGPRDIKP